MSEEQNDQLTQRRNMKVYYGHYSNRYNIVRHPVIRLKGHYLSVLGDFKVGDTVQVSITKGEITIKKVIIKQTNQAPS